MVNGVMAKIALKSDLKITMLYSTSLSANKILLLHLTSVSDQCNLSGTDPC
jgi:hypothetical protein